MRGAAAAAALAAALLGAWRVEPPAAQRAILFLQGAHVPDSGAPESRLYDPGDAPLSFTRLRREVLDGGLGLRVNEQPAAAPVTAAALRPYIAIVLGSNDRAFGPAEADALEAFVRGGGGLLTYADFQYGPANWASDNALLTRFGIEVLPDNFQPRTRIPVAGWGAGEIEVEGISQFRITSAAPAGIEIIARCEPQGRPGCALQPADQARLQPDDTVACAFAVTLPGGGRLAGVCDRNLFHNGPQKDGTDLGLASNGAFARNLFAWLVGR